MPTLLRPAAPLLASLLLAPSIAGAAVNTAPAVAKAGGGQRALAVGFDEQGQLRTRVCAGEPCTLDGASPIAVPADAARVASAAKLRVARLGLERKAIVVEIPLAEAGRSWVAVVVAPLAGAVALTPFAGYTGLAEGADGERSGAMVLVRDEGVYVGVAREGQDLCGRPAILAPEALDPATLTLKSAKIQRLTDAERQGAIAIAAAPTEPVALPALLTAQFATSAAPAQPPSALTDGKPETSWGENRGGSGRGEFAVLRAPSEVPLTAFEVVLPVPSTVPGGVHVASPSEIFLATDHEVYRVTFPKLPKAVPAVATLPQARYRIALPAAIKTSCVGVVLESSLDTQRDATVAIAEVMANPVAGGDVSLLIRALAGGGPDAEAAGAVLAASGPAAFSAVASAFASLDEGGRRVALGILDDAPCEVALPAYIEARLGPSEGNARHATGAFPRCPGAAAALAAALPPLDPEKRVVVAEEISTLSPEIMVTAVAPLFETAKQRERRAYRILVGNAGQQERARGAIRAELLREPASPRVLLEVLRALGPSLPLFGDAAARAFGVVAKPGANFRTRYLLLGPAAELASTNVAAREFLKAALTVDPRAEIRAESARAVRDGKAYSAELIRGADDRRVRVREASILALGASKIDTATPYVTRRLRSDGWPLVRGAAAVALAELAPSALVDTELSNAVEEDESPQVRRASIRALGAHRATAHGSLVRARFADAQEDPTVRAEAALALGALCDATSENALTESALKLVDPKATEDERNIGRSALSALGWIAPSDLERRIAPLRSEKMPAVVKKLASDALANRGRCASAPRAPAK